MLNLDIDHYRHLKDSAIEDDIAALNFRSWDANSEIDRDDVFSLIIPDPKYRNNGTLSGNSQNNLANILHGGGWLYEGFMGVSMKPDCPRNFVDKLTGKSKTIKYESVRGCQQLFVPRVSIRAAIAIATKLGVDREFNVSRDPNSEDLEFWHWFRASEFPLIVTEGCKKACATISAGYAAVGLNGVWGWGKNDIDMFGNVERDFNSQAVKTLNPDLHGFVIDREVILAFDFDTNPDTMATVTKASRLFAEKIVDISSKVSQLKWAGNKGIDDLIVARGVKYLDKIYTKRMEVKPVNPVGRPRRSPPNPVDRDYQQLAQELGFELLESGCDADGIPTSKLVKLELDLFAMYGSRLEFNEMSCEIELDRSPIVMDLSKSFVVKALSGNPSQQDCDIALASIARKNQYSPVKEYLESLRGKGQSSFIENFPQKYWGNDDPLQNMLFFKKLVACVARVMNPGCEDHTLLILKGGQGVGKSSALKALGSEEWFTDDLRSLDNKDELAKLSRFWLLELAEVDYLFSKKETTLFKRFLSGSKDTFRPPYGRSNITKPRTSALFATTNSSEFLSDPTGARRYWVVDVCQDVDIAQIRVDRDLIWAAAVAAYDEDVEWWLPKELELYHHQVNEQYQQNDMWDGLIEDRLSTITSFQGSIEYTFIPVVADKILNIPTDKQDGRISRRIGAILRLMGFDADNIRIDGKQTKVWARSSVVTQVFDKSDLSNLGNTLKPLPSLIVTKDTLDTNLFIKKEDKLNNNNAESELINYSLENGATQVTGNFGNKNNETDTSGDVWDVTPFLLKVGDRVWIAKYNENGTVEAIYRNDPPIPHGARVIRDSGKPMMLDILPENYKLITNET